MEAKWVIHTPGPIWKGGNHGEENLLRDSYRNSIMAANECGAKSISFPSISTGVYGFPIDKASKVAIQTVIDQARGTSIGEVHFILFSLSDFKIYEDTLKRVSNTEHS
jgi:O-acetyl-ADP-ribose deacetylase (regulator of RNase III)